MATWRLGRNAKLYYGDPETGLGALAVLGAVRDCTLNMDSETGDATARDSEGWASEPVVVRKVNSDFDLTFRTNDPGIVALEDSYLNSSDIELAILSGPRDASGSRGPKGRFVVTNFTRNEPRNDVITVSASVSMTQFEQYVRVP